MNSGSPHSNQISKDRGAIYYLLLDGYAPAAIAKKHGISRQAVWKLALKYEREGRIERTNHYPAMWQRKREIATKSRWVGDSNQIAPAHEQPNSGSEPPLTFHKFAVDFIQIGSPNLPKDVRGLAWQKHSSHTARFGRHTTTIWMKHYRGNSVQEQITNAQLDTLALARFYSEKYSIQLAFKRWHPDIEWCVTSKRISGQIAGKAGILAGGQKEVAGAVHKFGDASHPELVEFNQAHAGAPERPTEHAKTHEYLYSRLPFDMETIAKTMKEMSDTIIHLNQKIIMLEHGMRK